MNINSIFCLYSYPFVSLLVFVHKMFIHTFAEGIKLDYFWFLYRIKGWKNSISKQNICAVK